MQEQKTWVFPTAGVCRHRAAVMPSGALLGTLPEGQRFLQDLRGDEDQQFPLLITLRVSLK